MIFVSAAEAAGGDIITAPHVMYGICRNGGGNRRSATRKLCRGNDYDEDKDGLDLPSLSIPFFPSV